MGYTYTHVVVAFDIPKFFNILLRIIILQKERSKLLNKVVDPH
jgi:hypothetical protein